MHCLLSQSNLHQAIFLARFLETIYKIEIKITIICTTSLQLLEHEEKSDLAILGAKGTILTSIRSEQVFTILK